MAIVEAQATLVIERQTVHDKKQVVLEENCMREEKRRRKFPGGTCERRAYKRSRKWRILEATGEKRKEGNLRLDKILANRMLRTINMASSAQPRMLLSAAGELALLISPHFMPDGVISETMTSDSLNSPLSTTRIFYSSTRRAGTTTSTIISQSRGIILMS
ncbi:hypothetical protein KSP39_PZI019836 [Platanthera zijinensis]|uniref:Uncharacterized protein n=1 Tax=Platanthera zijinensis TaxID=2320716 RepID=A0AAP0B253_9ASPA